MVDNYKVLLTASGTGSRLGNITKFTNKSLVRVGEKPCISYIVEQYPVDVEIVVTLGYYGDHVREFLTLAYPERKFQFVTVDKYEGPGSSLLYSISKAKEHLQCPFIFHACDTITNNIKPPNRNWMAGYKNGDASQYRSFNVSGTRVATLNEKGEKNTDYYYMGVCGVYDYEMFWDILFETLTDRPDDTSLSDCHVLRKMIGHGVIEYEVMTQWLDVGNMESLKHAREQITDKFHILDKDEESIFLFDNFVIKFFHDKNICLNRIKRAKVLQGLVPEIIAHTDNFYKYEFVDADLMARKATPRNIEMLIQWARANLWNQIPIKQLDDVCKNFYIDKTVKRIESFLKQNNTVDKCDVINGVEVPTVWDMLKEAETILLDDIIPTGFHGDFILDNILIKNDGFVLLDWRQDFGGEIESGDMYYDVSKLNHNLILNHDIINDGLYFINTKDDGSIECDIMRSNRLVECQDTLFSMLRGISIQKVKVLTAIIWINMAPLHDRKLGNFLYYFGKYNLNKYLKEGK
jgi:choline kinase